MMRRLILILVWMVVSLPLAWGVYQSVQRSIPLFSGGPGVVPGR
jgi:hypothetical protein